MTERNNLFELIDRGSDLMVRARGSSFQDTLLNLVEGILDTVCDIDSVQVKETRKIFCRAPDPGRLVVRVCNDLIYLMDSEKLVFRGAEVKLREVAGTLECEVVLTGEHVDPARHGLKAYLKGASYGGLVVKPDTVEMVIDV